MDNKKNKLLIAILILVIIVVILLVILVNYKKEQNSNIDISQKPKERYTKIKEKYESNEFTFTTINTENLMSIYLNKYKDNISNNVEQAYNMLDEDYRNQKFGNIEEFRRYIENNKETILDTRLISYQTETNGDINRYICLDENGNYYIFDEKAIMDYTLILDTYTIDLPEFIEKYDRATEQQKVALNINKFIQAINDKDYKYAYNCLADSYKNNYFKTQAEFENYAKENFYANSTVAYSQFDTQEDVYTYSVILTNRETKEQMNKTFIMQLGEETEFVLSFNR